MKLTVSTTINAALATVWKARTTPEDIMSRNHAGDDRHCPAAIQDLRVGGVFSSMMAARDGSMSFNFTGQYDVVEPMSKIQYTMGAVEEHFVPAGRQCVVMFQEDDSCRYVTVTEVFDAEDTHDPDMQTAGRQAILDNFKKHVENTK